MEHVGNYKKMERPFFGYRATLCQYEIKSPLWAKVIEIDGKKIQP
jgi:hypothetical protein